MLQSPADQFRSLSAVYLISFQLSSRCVAANTQFHARNVPVGLSLFTGMQVTAQCGIVRNVMIPIDPYALCQTDSLFVISLCWQLLLSLELGRRPKKRFAHRCPSFLLTHFDPGARSIAIYSPALAVPPSAFSSDVCIIYIH
jgi:hypothetical protein